MSIKCIVVVLCIFVSVKDFVESSLDEDLLQLIDCVLKPLIPIGETVCDKLTPIKSPLSLFDGFYHVQERSKRPNQAPPRCSTTTIRTLNRTLDTGDEIAINHVFTILTQNNEEYEDHFCVLNIALDTGRFYSFKFDSALEGISELRYVAAEKGIGYIHAVCTSNQTFVTIATSDPNPSSQTIQDLKQKAAQNKLNVSDYTLAKINQTGCENNVKNQDNVLSCTNLLNQLLTNLIQSSTIPNVVNNCGTKTVGKILAGLIG